MGSFMTLAFWVRPWVIVLLAAMLGACSSAPRVPFSAEQQAVARVPGIPDARFWSDDPPPGLRDDVRNILIRARTASPAILALSGGGGAGAFGAGLLVGWSQIGTRPEFSIVSGVSAGALIAPFAFLGPEYDPVLQQVLTLGYASPLSQFNKLGILSSGLPNTAVLQQLVAQFVDAPMIDRIAAEHRRGRRLIVLTTNLDAQRSVVWNLGAVAASDRPDRLEIIRSVLVASASIPGVFAPVLIDVEAEGQRFAEMHVDGGVTRNLFVAPDPVLAAGAFLPPRTSGRIFIIVNNKVAPDFQVVENSLLPIVERSVSTLVKANTSSVLLASYQFARANRLEFNLAAIDPAYPIGTSENFEREYMLGLFQHGIERAHSNQMWQKTPVPPTLNNPRPQGIASSRNSRVGAAVPALR
jgi:predicted acylesterase/phospholipase RssA